MIRSRRLCANANGSRHLRRAGARQRLGRVFALLALAIVIGIVGPVRGAAWAADVHFAAIYLSKCATCHGKSVTDFARASLVDKKGIIVGVDNQLELAKFLQGHGRLRPDEIPLVVQALTEALKEPVPAR